MFLTLFAALGVATSELPECLNLTDNVSNNADVPVLLQRDLLSRSTLLRGPRADSPAYCAARLEQKSRELALAVRCPLFFQAIKSPLLLVCVQRK